MNDQVLPSDYQLFTIDNTNIDRKRNWYGVAPSNNRILVISSIYQLLAILPFIIKIAAEDSYIAIDTEFDMKNKRIYLLQLGVRNICILIDIDVLGSKLCRIHQFTQLMMSNKIAKIGYDLSNDIIMLKTVGIQVNNIVDISNLNTISGLYNLYNKCYDTNYVKPKKLLRYGWNRKLTYSHIGITYASTDIWMIIAIITHYISNYITS